MSWWEGIKDELGWSVEDAAEQELRQTTRKGYDPSRGKDGAIKRGFFESIGDILLDNDPKEIQRRAQELYVEGLNKTNNSKYGLSDINTRLEAIGEAPITITSNTTQAEIDKQINKLNRTLPQLEAIRGAGGSLEGLSTNTDSGTLTSRLDEAQTDRQTSKYYDSPQYQQYLDQLRKSDQNFQATMALQTGQMALANKRADNQMEIAMLNNQLESRRMDSADRRADRRDRQAMIQQLMSGLSALGASIAI